VHLKHHIVDASYVSVLDSWMRVGVKVEGRELMDEGDHADATSDEGVAAAIEAH